MAVKFYNDVNFRQNKLQNILLDPVSAFPTGPKNGQIVFRQDQGVFYWWNASVPGWVPLGNVSVIAEAGSGLTSAPQPDGSYKISFNPNTAFLSINLVNNTVGIIAEAISDNELKTDAVTTIKVKAKAIAFAKIQDIPTMTLIGRVSAGTGSPESVSFLDQNDLGANSNTAVPTQSSVKAYVDSKMGTFGQYEGPYDAAAASGNFPQLLTGNLKGSFWDISTHGTLQGIELSPGDVVMSKKLNASPTDAADWLIFQGNLEAATETRAGYLRIATQAEVDLGADDTTVVTPKKLLNSSLLQGKRYTTALGDGTTTVFTVIHNLAVPLPTVDLYNKTTNRPAYTTWSILDMNRIQVTFTTAPTATQFTIVIKPS